MPARNSDIDACPGALRLHSAADGPLARVRLPGGLLTGERLAVLGELCAEFGDGHLELTSRANVQLRALRVADPAVLAVRLSAAGLLPSETHETVRNVVAPPLADSTLRTLVEQLDVALCADPALAALPGRFLFAVGDVSLAADLAAVPTGGEFTILFAGRDLGVRVPVDQVGPALLTGANAFLTERAATPVGAPAWRLHELPDGPDRVAERVAAALDLPRPVPGPDPERPSALSLPVPDSEAAALAGALPITGSNAAALAGALPVTGSNAAALAGALPITGSNAAALVGLLPQADGLVAVGALVPLGRLGGAALRLLATARRLVVTTARGVIVPDLTPEAARRWARALAEAGLEVEGTSRWVGVTACAGRPGCAKSLADVRADADGASAYSDGLPVHWVGCARGCGSPSGPHVRVEATPDGYAVTRQPGGKTYTGDPARAVAAARRN
ncbi:precorrin-3B synthase [Paractinoplanes hotanensis]|uniref:Precorrin-3B synthase n=1 Tax=Paractinoplanes hotanensis TaxID=2906497 RepID=A0ABT0XX83_9ACTN|nr:precorrin-3B synthase [Actinoplanes hotanensis]MCM4078374.1 precorrin-3B synthase [Actinoplanes hotanensis]